MPMSSTARRVHEVVDGVAAVVVTVSRGLAFVSFGAALVIGVAILFEMEEHPAHWVLALAVLVFVLSLPGWVLLGFRAAVVAAREIPEAVQAWPQTVHAFHGRIRSADGGLATSTEAGRAAWEGGRQLGLFKAAWAITRLSFVLWALVCAGLAVLEVVLAVAVVTGTVLL
jgi:hypothetical protein